MKIHRQVVYLIFTIVFIIGFFNLAMILGNRLEEYLLAGEVLADSGSAFYLPKEEEQESIYFEQEWYTPRKDLTNLLIMGIDDFGIKASSNSYNNSGQADFLALVVLNEGEKTFQILHLNRDTMTDIPVWGMNGEMLGTHIGQLAFAHTYGSGLEDSCENTVQAVSHLLYGAEIDYYVSVNMDAAAKLNDMVGGVEVRVLVDFSAVDQELKKDQMIRLKGDQALTYVRTKLGVGDETNLARMDRQKQYMEGLVVRLRELSAEDESFLFGVFHALSEYMVTDVDLGMLERLSGILQEYEFQGSYSLAGDVIKGERYMEFYVNEEVLKRQMLQLYYVEVE